MPLTVSAKRFFQLTIICIVLLILLPVLAQDNRPTVLDEKAEQVKNLMANSDWLVATPLLYELIEESEKGANWMAYSTNAISLAKALHMLGRIDSCCEMLENVTQKLQRINLDKTQEAASLYNYLALSFARADRYSQALNAYNNAISIFEQLHITGDKPSFAYRNAAQILVRRDDHTNAIRYFEASVRLDTSGKYLVANYAQLANNYHFMGDEQAVMRYYLKGMDNPKRNEEETAKLQANGCSAFIAKGDFQKAKSMMNVALSFYNSNPNKFSDQIIRCFTSLADIAIRQNKRQEAESYFLEAENKGKKFYEGKSREMAKLYVETGQFYEQSSRPERALDCYQKALVQAFPNFNSLNIADNPTLEEASLESQALRAAAAKAQVLLINSTVSENTRLNAAHCFDLSFAIAAKATSDPTSPTNTAEFFMRNSLCT